MTNVCIQRIATATPQHDIHEAFVDCASMMLKDGRARSLFRYMAVRAGIEHRFSYICPEDNAPSEFISPWEMVRAGHFPSTERRMHLFELFAPRLMHDALDRLSLTDEERASVRHVIVTTCTGFFAPGLDFSAVQYLGLDPGVERTVIGFMGCYAAINGLKLARHIVRSEPAAAVLLINLELCTLHLQETQQLESMLSFLLFGDGCAASLIRASEAGLAIDSFKAITIPDTANMIRWNIGGSGFDMVLSGQVPLRLRRTLEENAVDLDPKGDVQLWAVHPGGRSILDAVEAGLRLDQTALNSSRFILRQFGNMSSATVMFVLDHLSRTAKAGQAGCAISFGPGLTAETMKFHVI